MNDRATGWKEDRAHECIYLQEIQKKGHNASDLHYPVGIDQCEYPPCACAGKIVVRDRATGGQRVVCEGHLVLGEQEEVLYE